MDSARDDTLDCASLLISNLPPGRGRGQGICASPPVRGRGVHTERAWLRTLEETWYLCTSGCTRRSQEDSFRSRRPATSTRPARCRDALCPSVENVPHRFRFQIYPLRSKRKPGTAWRTGHRARRDWSNVREICRELNRSGRIPECERPGVRRLARPMPWLELRPRACVVASWFQLLNYSL